MNPLAYLIVFVIGSTAALMAYLIHRDRKAERESTPVDVDADA